MFTINRSLLVVKPKQPYIDWVMGLPGSDSLDPAEVLNDCTTVLIPEVDSRAAAERHIRRIWSQLFEIELAAWSTDLRSWPQPRDHQTFVAWFDLELHMLVLDPGADPIEKEPY